MHELGIIVHISRTLTKLADEKKLSKIGSVTLEVGVVSGIVPDYMTDAWNYYKKKTPLLSESELRMETLPAVTFCEECGNTYETVRYGKICPRCSSPRTYLLTGSECSIKEIEAC